MLDGTVTDRTEASSLGYASDLVDIYSSSWGPQDDGATVDGPGKMVLEILDRGTRKVSSIDAFQAAYEIQAGEKRKRNDFRVGFG